MKFIKRYKRHNIYQLESGCYVFAILKTNIANSYIEHSKEFSSVRKCKCCIKDLGGKKDE